MLSALLLSLLAAAPDEFGTSLHWEELAYLGARLHQESDPKALEQLDLTVCSALFDDCRLAADEFDRKRALERHAAELAQLKASVATLSTGVLGATICLNDYDFKTKRFPVSSVSLEAVPNATDLRSLPINFSPRFPATPLLQSLKVPPDVAELIRKSQVLPCFAARVAVTISTPSTPMGHVPVKIKRARILHPETGATLATF